MISNQQENKEIHCQKCIRLKKIIVGYWFSGTGTLAQMSNVAALINFSAILKRGITQE